MQLVIDVFEDCNTIPTFLKLVLWRWEKSYKRQATPYLLEYPVEGNLMYCKSGEMLFLGDIPGLNFVF